MTPSESSPVATANTGSRAGALELRHVTKAFATSHTVATAVDDFTATIEPGQFVTLLGPSGCGKTTTLRMIAGFETPTSGEILLDGASMVSVPPNRRPMSMVFQSYALFPNLNVADNISFGLRVKRVAKAERIRRVAAAMEQVGIAEYVKRYPHELSGGQQQRVALARALVMEPKILLFDEPLSNLDAKLRERMRDEIKAIQARAGITSVFVTHDQSEAMTMSDVIVVMNRGRIEQIGAPHEVYRRPATRFVAAFLGKANFVDAEVTAVHPDSTATVQLPGIRLTAPCHADVAAGRRATVMIRSEAVRLTDGCGAVTGTVTTAAFDGAITQYRVNTEWGPLQVDSTGTETPRQPGSTIGCELANDQVWILPGEQA
ncbi:MAG: ABC transporter ATP-binding protein [Propionibacteriaceae bacterium]|jgi:iron(III) transport system ATP-binding protein|nr:ABC transporter ATP-binding protein [Propionibacteriaceae bacterium]